MHTINGNEKLFFHFKLREIVKVTNLKDETQLQ